MRIREAIHMRVAVLKLYGKLMSPTDSEKLISKVKELMNEGFRRIVMDLKHLRWINSQGVGALMHCYQEIQRHEGRLLLARLSDKVQSVMAISSLQEIFVIEDTLHRAVQTLDEEF